MFVEGGNVNLPISGVGYNFAPFATCPQERCDLGSLGTLDFSHDNGAFHLDAGDPFHFPGGTSRHIGVDILGGNLLYWVIPH